MVTTVLARRTEASPTVTAIIAAARIGGSYSFRLCLRQLAEVAQNIRLGVLAFAAVLAPSVDAGEYEHRLSIPARFAPGCRYLVDHR
jgi:hypothetical protein